MKNKSKINLRKLVTLSILSAMSFVLFMFPKFPLLAAFPWLDFDFSDVPALFASLTISPLGGLCVVLVKNLIHLPLTTTAGVGEISNFLINGSFVFAAGLVCKYATKSNKKVSAVVLSIICGIAVQIIAAVFVNYFIMIPMYSAFVNFEELGGAKYYILAGVIPFNIIKDILASTVFVAVYKLISNKIHTVLAK